MKKDFHINVSIYEKMVSELISDAYTIGTNGPEFEHYINYIKTSRNSGFQVICTLEDLNESDQMCCAAKLLISIFGIWLKADIPKRLILQKETKLYKDAKLLVRLSLRNYSELKNQQYKQLPYRSKSNKYI